MRGKGISNADQGIERPAVNIRSVAASAMCGLEAGEPRAAPWRPSLGVIGINDLLIPFRVAKRSDVGRNDAGREQIAAVFE
jgi:hypothetical protein